VATGEDPWTAAELAALREELEADLERLRSELTTIEDSIADVLRDSGDGSGDDQADTGTKAFEREQEMTLLANTRDSLTQTAHALERLADGRYGICESCGGPVGKARLQAFPRATVCVVCKQQQERR
jgi:RNA polymerase-binding protein DksA